MKAALPHFASAPPTFENEAVLLRAWNERDLTVLAAAFAIADIAASLRPPVPVGMPGAREWVNARRAMPVIGRGAPYAIVPAGEEQPVGSVELRIRNAAAQIAEVGYWLMPDGRGRGLGRAAVELTCGWALEQPTISRIEAIIDRNNVRSQRLVRSLGFEHLEDLASNEGWRGDWLKFGRVV